MAALNAPSGLTSSQPQPAPGPAGYGQDGGDEGDAQDHRRPAEYQARKRQAGPCSPVRLIWLLAT